MKMNNKKNLVRGGIVSVLLLFTVSLFLYINREYKANVILLLIVYSLIVLGVFVYSLRTSKDLLNIANIFIPVYFLYTSGYPLNEMYYGFTDYYHKYIFYLILCMMGFIAFSLAYFTLFNKNKKKNINIPGKLEGNELKLVLISISVFFALACVSFYTELRAYGGIVNYIKVGYGAKRYLIDRSRVFGNGLQWISSCVLLLYALISSNKERVKMWLKIFVYSASLFLILIYFFTGNRHNMVIFIVTFAAIFHYNVKKIAIKKGIIGFSVLFILLIMYTSLRAFLNVGFSGFFSNLISMIQNKRVQFFYFQIGEFAQPSKSLNEVIYYANSNGYLLGKSYLIALVGWIPGAGRLFDVSKYALSVWRLKEFYPGYFEQGKGLGFLSLSEMYLNFGAIGIFAFMLLWGCILKKLYCLHKQYKNNIYITFIYCYSIAMTSFNFMRIDFQSFVGSYMQGIAIPLIFIIFTRILIDKVRGKKLSA